MVEQSELVYGIWGLLIDWAWFNVSTNTVQVIWVCRNQCVNPDKISLMNYIKLGFLLVNQNSSSS